MKLFSDFSVLIVEDDDFFIKVLEKLFLNFGCKLYLAKDFKTAQNILQNQTIHMTTIDINLGQGEDGVTLLEHIQTQNSQILSYMISGDHCQQQVEKSLKIGAYDFVTKPFNAEFLARRLKAGLHHLHYLQLKTALVDVLNSLKTKKGLQSSLLKDSSLKDHIEKLIHILSEDPFCFRNNHVLVVDDEESVRFLLSKVVARQKVIVHQAENGKEGLEIIKKESIHLALIDRNMPVMDGFQMFKLAKANFKNFEGVLISGDTSDEQLIEANKLGMADYIPKPALINLVISRLKKNLSQINCRQLELNFNTELQVFFQKAFPDNWDQIAKDNGRSLMQNFLEWLQDR